MDSGSDLLSRAVSSQVPSALKGLTAVFGMGTGGTPSSLPPEIVNFLSRFGFRFHSAASFALLSLCFRFALSAASFSFVFSPALRIVSRSPLPVNPFRLSVRFFRCPLRLPLHPDNCTLNDSRLTVQLVSVRLLCFLCSLRSLALNQALDLLVSSSSICYHTSTDDLSTW